MIRNFFIYLSTLILALVFFVLMVLFVIPALQESTFVLIGLSSNSSDSLQTDKSVIEEEVSSLQKKLDSYTPTNPYMIVNTSDNHFFSI